MNIYANKKAYNFLWQVRRIAKRDVENARAYAVSGNCNSNSTILYVIPVLQLAVGAYTFSLEWLWFWCNITHDSSSIIAFDYSSITLQSLFLTLVFLESIPLSVDVTTTFSSFSWWQLEERFLMFFILLCVLFRLRKILIRGRRWLRESHSGCSTERRRCHRCGGSFKDISWRCVFVLYALLFLFLRSAFFGKLFSCIEVSVSYPHSLHRWSVVQA